MRIREDFEAWAKGVDLPLELDEHECFVDARVGIAANAYQAATSHQDAKIKALVEALELLDAAYCENDMSTREARHRGRVALIKSREAIAAAKETP